MGLRRTMKRLYYIQRERQWQLVPKEEAMEEVKHFDFGQFKTQATIFSTQVGVEREGNGNIQ